MVCGRPAEMSIAGFEGLKLPDLSIRAGPETLATRNTLVEWYLEPKTVVMAL